MPGIRVRSWIDLILSALIIVCSVGLFAEGVGLTYVSFQGLTQHKERCTTHPGLPGCTARLPWIYPAFISLGVIIILITLLGILSGLRHGRSLITCYASLQFMLLLLQVGLFIAVLCDHKWQGKLPDEQSEEIEEVKKQLAKHLRAVKLTAGLSLVLNAAIFFISSALGAYRMRQASEARLRQRTAAFANAQGLRQPLLSGSQQADPEDDFYYSAEEEETAVDVEQTARAQGAQVAGVSSGQGDGAWLSAAMDRYGGTCLTVAEFVRHTYRVLANIYTLSSTFYILQSHTLQ